MRRLSLVAATVLAALTAVATAVVTATPAVAESGGASAVPGKRVCAITDERLDEISGLVATASGYVAINAISDNPNQSHQKIFLLNKSCKVTKTGSYGANGPADPQDIAQAKDGTLWIADVGDRRLSRSSVAFWKVPANLSTPAALYRVRYPDGAHNAKAILLTPDGTPMVVTAEGDRSARLYVPTAALSATATIALRLAATVTLPDTLSPNVFGGAGRKTVVDAASSPDGTKVALRTYADAFEWDVANGDIVAALATQPRVTGLTGEPFNESLTYSADGKAFISASMSKNVAQYAENVTESVLLSWTPNTLAFVPPKTKSADEGKSWLVKWLAGLTLDQMYLLFAMLGVFGLMLVAIGVIVTMKWRKRPGNASRARGRRRQDDDDDEYDEDGYHDDYRDSYRGNRSFARVGRSQSIPPIPHAAGPSTPPHLASPAGPPIIAGHPAAAPAPAASTAPGRGPAQRGGQVYGQGQGHPQSQGQGQGQVYGQSRGTVYGHGPHPDANNGQNSGHVYGSARPPEHR